MAPELFSEEIKPRQFQPTPLKIDFPFRRMVRNPAREVFDKLSTKLKGQHLPGVELAEIPFSFVWQEPAGQHPGTQLHIHKVFSGVSENKRGHLHRGGKQERHPGVR